MPSSSSPNTNPRSGSLNPLFHTFLRPHQIRARYRHNSAVREHPFCCSSSIHWFVALNKLTILLHLWLHDDLTNLYDRENVAMNPNGNRERGRANHRFKIPFVFCLCKSTEKHMPRLQCKEHLADGRVIELISSSCCVLIYLKTMSFELCNSSSDLYDFFLGTRVGCMRTWVKLAFSSHLQGQESDHLWFPPFGFHLLSEWCRIAH